MFRLASSSRTLARSFSTSTRTLQILPGTPEAFRKHAIDGSKPVIVDFYADWCGPCRMLTPVLERVVNEESGFDLIKIDTDAEGELAAKYKVSALPTVLAIKNGQVLGQFKGAVPEGHVLKFLKDIQSK
ncbi:thioredoxin family protein [Sporobolomyces salmoneus]|uniref:thioredoxin family protein n=1 Tax=Sporobolomyces salmoneus TaxID=183962 RepID=UPI003175E781